MTVTSPKQQVTIEAEMRKSYLDYAMSVIIGRAIPDVRDGLKPVHRRILYSMHEQSVHWNRGYKKSARIVGDVLGKYHPHGDSAVYDALVRMAQDFSLRMPLVDGQGNFGSIDGDPPAAMRYTEVRMQRLASELLADIDKQTVDFGPNFDDSEQEPLVLPSRFPNLLVNGAGGIAVGMATNIPPHNLKELIDATLRIIENPEITIPELMQDEPETGRLGVKGPDFPTAGIIRGRSGIVKAFETGRGRVVMRARATIEPMKKGDREQIIVTELPYQVNKANLIRKIADLVRDKKLEGISHIRDESDRQGMRVVLELKRDAYGEIVLNSLYQHTALQSSFGVNCLAIVAGRPQLLDLKTALRHFIDHRREVVTRRTRYELRQAERQLELVEGLGMAVTDVDLVVKTIRDSRDPEEARGRLMKLPLKGLEEFVRRAGRPDEEITEAKKRGDYFLSERQAKAILDMRLAKLTGLEREKLAEEYGQLCEVIARLRKILGSEVELFEVIKAELAEVRERYGDERRTEITDADGDIDMEDLIADEEVAVTVTSRGYIKRVAITEFRAQARGGTGKKGLSMRDEDFVKYLYIANAHAHVLFLNDRGTAYLKKIWQIPEGSRTTKPRAIVNFVGMEPSDRVAAIVPIREFVEDGYLLTVTKKGRVKRTVLKAYDNIRVTGIIGVKITDGDELLTARVVTDGQHVMLGTKQGMSIRFNIDDVRPMGRDSQGVKGISLREGDEVIGLAVVEDDKQVLAVSANGYGKRTNVDQWRSQTRGGLGIKAMVINERNGELVKLRMVAESDQLMVITDGGQVIRTRCEEISEIGRNTQGVRVIRLRKGEHVVDVEPVIYHEDNPNPSMAPDAAEAEAAEGEDALPADGNTIPSPPPVPAEAADLDGAEEANEGEASDE